MDTTATGKEIRVFRTGNDTTSVPLNEISHISVKRSARLRGFVIGAFLDFVAFAVLQEVWESANAQD